MEFCPGLDHHCRRAVRQVFGRRQHDQSARGGRLGHRARRHDQAALWPRIPGAVIAIVPTANREKATVKVRVGMDLKDPRILPDMAIKVTFLDDGAPAAARPDSP